MKIKSSDDCFWMVWWVTAVNEIHVYSYNNEPVRPTSSPLISEYIISVFTLKGRIFMSRDCVLYHCLGQLPYLRPTNCIIVPQSIPVYWQSQWETHLLSARIISWGLYKRIPWPLSVSGISQAQQAPDYLPLFPPWGLVYSVNQCPLFLDTVVKREHFFIIYLD